MGNCNFEIFLLGIGKPDQMMSLKKNWAAPFFCYTVAVVKVTMNVVKNCSVKM